MTTLHQLGTFDVANFGDLLYPPLFAWLARRHGARTRAVSPLGGAAPDGAGFASAAARRLLARGAPLALVIGGGDLLRLDVDVVAGHYRPERRLDPRALARALGVRGALRHLLWPRRADFVARFRRRALAYGAPAPFVIDPAPLPRGSSVSYLSVGVPHELDRAAGAAVERARFVWVRDGQSAAKLRRAGVARPVHVAPDLAVLVEEWLPRAQLAPRGRELLAARGVGGGRVTGVHSAPGEPDDLVAALRRLRARGDEVVLLPIGRCHGDAAFLRRVGARAGVPVVEARTPRDVLATIAACDQFAGTSLHGNVVAFSYGIPHLFGPLRVAKNAGFLDVVGGAPEQLLASWRELDERLRWSAAQDRSALIQRAEAARARTRAAAADLVREALR